MVLQTMVDQFQLELLLQHVCSLVKLYSLFAAAVNLLESVY